MVGHNNYRNIFSIDFNLKTIAMLTVLAILPNLLGMINMPTVFGFKIHTFQYIVFIAAALYGPIGGGVSGGVGSLFSAFALGNPYIVIGNILLGFVAGFMFKKGYNMIVAGMTAYAIQMPWLYLSDIYFVGMPQKIVISIIIALFISDLIWSTLAHFTHRKVATFSK